MGSSTPQGRRRTRVYVPRRLAFRVVLPRRHPELVFSELHGQPAYTPVPRFKGVLAERPRRARGQDGSLLLSCMTLSFTTPRRFIPTLSEQLLPKLYSFLIFHGQPWGWPKSLPLHSKEDLALSTQYGPEVCWPETIGLASVNLPGTLLSILRLLFRQQDQAQTT